MDIEYILLQWDNYHMVFCPKMELENYIRILRRDRKQDYYKIEYAGDGYWIKLDDRS